MSYQSKLKKITPEFVKAGASKITEVDLAKAVEKGDEIWGKVTSHGPLAKFIEDIKLLIDLISDYYTGKYKSIPWWALSAIVFTLLYVLNPFDLIPDFIPIIGYVDDAAVVGICLRLCHEELQRYKASKS